MGNRWAEGKERNPRLLELAEITGAETLLAT